MRHVIAGLLLLYAGSTLTLFAQAPAPPPPPTSAWSGDLGAGLALTSGNTDTKNFNLSFGLAYDPKTRNTVKAIGLYIRGDKDGAATVDRTAFNVRDEYKLSDRTYLFGQTEYLRDTFKQIDYLISPSAGFGYKLLTKEPLLFSVDAGFGALWERNPGRDTSFTGSPNLGERLTWKLSDTATLTHSISSLWKTSDFGDSLHNIALGLAVAVAKRLQIKTEIIDSYKSRPPGPTVKKNDVSFLTTLVVKFP